MCLLKQSTRLKATKDIVCYKVCKCFVDESIHSFYFDEYKWKLNKVYEAEHAHIAYTSYSVYDGYFHTFASPEMANAMLVYPSARLFKCIIPKGTYYFKGIHQGGKDGYASKKLKIVEMV